MPWGDEPPLWLLPEEAPAATPVELDIGFGLGASLFERAANQPAAYLVGIEVRRKHALAVQSRCQQRGLTRVRVLIGDARQLLPRCRPAACLSRVSLHFPDPWWKKRHAKRRVLTTPLLDELARLMSAEGELLIQTDVEERAVDYHRLVAQHGAFCLQGEDGWVQSNPFGACSNRERRAAADGLPVWRLLARRRDMATL